MDKKRIFFSLLFIVSTILIGYALYRVFFAPSAPTDETPGSSDATNGQFPTAGEGTPPGTTQGGTVPTSLPTSGGTSIGTIPTDTGTNQTEQPRVSQVIQEPVHSVAVSSNGTPSFYNARDGKFYRIGEDGAPIPISDTTFYNVSNATWSPDGNDAIIEYPDGANIYYDFNTQTQVTLPKHWEDFSFDASGSHIAAKSIGFSEENRWLVVSDPKGNTVTPIEPLGQQADKVIVDWSPNGQVLALSRTGEPLDANRQEVLLIGQYGENFKSIIVEGRDLRTQWSPSGDTLLHSVYSARSGYVPELWIVNASGDSTGAGRKLLGVQTWADKCAFADDRYVYCGVPTSIESGAGFVPALADQTPDELLRIDTQTGLKQPIQLDAGDHTIAHISVDTAHKKIYFTDTNKAGLFSVDL